MIGYLKLTTQMLRDIFQRENKYIVCIVALCLSSCGSKTNCENYIEQEFLDYSKVYEIATDSLKQFQLSGVKDFSYTNMDEWQLDSVILFNHARNLAVGIVLYSSGVGETATSDGSSKVLLKLIGSTWYLIPSSNLVIPRDMYGKDENHRISFSELSKIAREQFMESALVKDEGGKWSVSDKWVENHFYYHGMCADCNTTQEYDSVHWFKIMDKWNHRIDTTKFKRNKPVS